VFTVAGERSIGRREAQPLRLVAGLRGRLVRDRFGEVAGSISELIFDGQRGCIAYALVARGGFVGVGERLFPVPWTALRRRGADFVLPVATAALEAAPAFEPEQCAAVAPPAWHERVHAHFAARPYWT
jgi:hypothetical protein